MGDLMLIIIHIACVTSIYISAYRIGYKAAREESIRRAEANAAPLAEILEQLNLDMETFVDDEKEP